VQSAVGYQAARGDMVAVVGMGFAPVAPIISAPVGWEMAPQEMVRPGIWLLGLLAVFIVALKLIRALRVTAAPAPAETAPAAIGAAPTANVLHPTGLESAVALPPPGPAIPTPRDRVVDLIDERPDVAARLVRSWLKEAAT
jgi:flagellar biosynthesis/type III secretory pathway M-ring protein FliF/YscJ